MRTRRFPISTVRQIARPDSPGCSVVGTCDQVVVWNGTSVIRISGSAYAAGETDAGRGRLSGRLLLLGGAAGMAAVAAELLAALALGEVAAGIAAVPLTLIDTTVTGRVTTHICRHVGEVRAGEPRVQGREGMGHQPLLGADVNGPIV